MTDAILTLNAGSSSIKFAVFPLRAGAVAETPLAEGEAGGIGDAAHLQIVEAGGQSPVDHHLPAGSDQDAALEEILRWIRAHSAGLSLIGAGHRVVHGGPAFMWMTRLLQAADEFVTDAAEGATAGDSHIQGS